MHAHLTYCTKTVIYGKAYKGIEYFLYGEGYIFRFTYDLISRISNTSSTVT